MDEQSIMHILSFFLSMWWLLGKQKLEK